MLKHLCARYELPVDYNVAVRKITRLEQGKFLIETDASVIRARYAVIATGLKPFTCAIPGIEHATPYAEIKPAKNYRDKRVLIIGKGNSGFECAKDLLNDAAAIMIASPNPVRLAYQTHYVGSVRATNTIHIENYQLKHNAAILDCDIHSIERVADTYRVKVVYKHAGGRSKVSSSMR